MYIYNDNHCDKTNRNITFMFFWGGVLFSGSFDHMLLSREKKVGWGEESLFLKSFFPHRHANKPVRLRPI